MNDHETVDLLIRADFVYPVDGRTEVIADGEIAVSGDRIIHVGRADPRRPRKARRVLGGPGFVALPGFVNCHSHAASVVFRSQTDDHEAKKALLNVAFPMEKDVSTEEWRLLGELGCADMLLAGVTTINDIWYSPETLAETVQKAGLRAQIANKVFDVRLENLRNGDYTHHAAIGEKRLAAGVAFAERWHGAAAGRITARIGPHATDTCDVGLFREARREASRLGIGMHIHAAQSAAEAEHIRGTYGCGPVRHLAEAGMLAPDVVLAHLVFAEDDDLAAAAEHGAGYAHCPTIYPRRGRYPRLEAILERGIPTGFATDWMLNDPFEGMRYAINAMRLRLGSPSAMSGLEALRFQTLGAARVLGLDGEIGSLEAGKKADIILVSTGAPHLQPYYGGPEALVFYAKATDVHTSVIDGRVVMEGRRIPGLDEAVIQRDIRAATPGWRRRLHALGSRAVFGPGCDCCG